MFDPFEEENKQAVDLFRKWMLDNGEEFTKYEEEIEEYNSQTQGYTDPPSFFYKSADKYILKALESFKDGGVEKPATTFFQLMEYVFQKRPRPFTKIIYQRIKEDIELLEQFKSPAYKDKAKQKLMERGFI